MCSLQLPRGTPCSSIIGLGEKIVSPTHPSCWFQTIATWDKRPDFGWPSPGEDFRCSSQWSLQHDRDITAFSSLHNPSVLPDEGREALSARALLGTRWGWVASGNGFSSSWREEGRHCRIGVGGWTLIDSVQATVAAREGSQNSGAKNSETSFGLIVLTHFTLHFLMGCHLGWHF